MIVKTRAGKQYCKYCKYCVWKGYIYCEVFNKRMSEKEISEQNKCTDFENMFTPCNINDTKIAKQVALFSK